MVVIKRIGGISVTLLLNDFTIVGLSGHTVPDDVLDMEPTILLEIWP